ncbi:CPC_1213 family protein [Clostridium sp. JNZ J1-5]|nr:CPC_1213 family protein [Clostridium sp.]
MSNNKMRNTQNNKKEDGKFKKINIKHGQAESSRAAFNPNDGKDIKE